MVQIPSSRNLETVHRTVSQAVEKPLTGFSDKFLQSAARTPCSPTANNSHTCSLRSIFCQVHAPTENDFDFI